MPEDIGKDPAYTHVVIPYLFSRKSEVLFNRKAFPMLCGPASSAGWLWGKVINNRVSPGITDQIQIWIFVNNTGEIFLGVPAVTKDYDILLRSKRGHALTHHGCGKLQFRLFFLPHAVTERDRQISNPAVAPYGDTKHEADKAMAVQIVGAIVCCMVKKF